VHCCGFHFVQEGKSRRSVLKRSVRPGTETDASLGFFRRDVACLRVFCWHGTVRIRAARQRFLRRKRVAGTRRNGKGAVGPVGSGGEVFLLFQKKKKQP